jgi:hypothetical protein
MTVKVKLPDNLLEQAERSAASLGISVDELIQSSLEDKLQVLRTSFDPEKDPFFSDKEFYSGPTPPDLIDNLDEHLYGSED